MPSDTPLTDAINALTTYANTVTGKTPPDTTLSDAVATLAAGYGGGGVDLTAIKQDQSKNNIGGLFKAFMDGTWGYVEVTVTSGMNPITVNFGRAIKGFVAYPKTLTIPSGLSNNEKYKISIAVFQDEDENGHQDTYWNVWAHKNGSGIAATLFNRITSASLDNGVLTLVPQYPSNANYNPFTFGEPNLFVYWY